MTNLPPSAPVVVNGSPSAVQIEAGIRQLIMIVGSVAAAFGAKGMAGDLNGVLAIVGPLATVVAFIWGQMATRSKAKAAITIANMLPDSKATTT